MNIALRPGNQREKEEGAMSVHTIRARVRAGQFVPFERISFPEGTEVSLQVEETATNTVQALLAVMRDGPHLEPGDVDALEAAIESGKVPVRDEGIFDEPKV